MPSTIIRRLALTSATGGVLVLAGCSAVGTNGPATGVQVTPLSETLTVSQPFCVATNNPTVSPGTTTALRAAPAADPGCGPYSGYTTLSSSGPTYRPFTSGGGGRLLVAVQVADGVADPTLKLRRRPDVAFVSDPAALAKVPAAPAGRHWVGYRSGEVRFAKDEQNAGDVVDATVPVSRTDPRPSSVSQATTIAIGDQVTGNGFGAEYPADRPVSCDEDLSSTPNHNADVSTTTCPGQTTNSPFGNGAPSASTATVSTTDATISGPTQETAATAGSTATVAFSVAQAGDAPGDLQLSASTTVPSGQTDATPGSVPWQAPPVPTPPTDTTTTVTTTTAPATTTTPQLLAAEAPAARTTDVAVGVSVPAATPSGVYDVTLKGTDDGGSRTATARIRVTNTTTPPDAAPTAPTPAEPVAPSPPSTPVKPSAPTKPTVGQTASVRLTKVATVNRKTRKLTLGRVRCARTKVSCTVSTKIKIGTRTIGTLKTTIKPKSAKTLTIRLTRANLKRLLARPAKATTTVTATGSKKIVRTTTVRIKPARKDG